ncbi:MAG: 3-deoxy-7-phosphoheptulonate synthase, partial [Clostridiales bacterium]|nr:3-deoxy-7-phosphoheptulonate synthase [Clostridiales bacterium]
MILIIKPEVKRQNIDNLIEELHAKNFRTHLSVGENTTIIGLIGDTSRLDINEMRANAL